MITRQVHTKQAADSDSLNFILNKTFKSLNESGSSIYSKSPSLYVNVYYIYPTNKNRAIVRFIWRTKSRICVPITAIVYICSYVPWFSLSWILNLYELLELHNLILKTLAQCLKKKSTLCQVIECVSYFSWI